MTGDDGRLAKVWEYHEGAVWRCGCGRLWQRDGYYRQVMPSPGRGDGEWIPAPLLTRWRYRKDR